ncbi:MAG: N-acetylmuramoyl-L-alanine amidase [Clostridia bacterium]|nr:N-acetylmuramoyl-L-alanine amidase [Clostridia bacterium]
MIVVVRKRNIALILMIFLLSIILYNLNIGRDEAAAVTNTQDGQKTVILDPGHGGEDPGAVSDYSGLKEKDVNLNIALLVKGMLESENYKVIMTREEDVLQYEPDTRGIIQKRKQDLLKRKKLMDEAGANIVVSVHLNKFPQTQYFGAQTFFPPNSPESQKLAMSIQKAIRQSVDPENKREANLKKEPIIILKDCKTTTAIVECGFLSNPDEEKKLVTKEYQEKVAIAIKDGIKQYFEKK